MAPLSLFVLAILVVTAQAAPARPVTTTLLAAAFPDLPNGRPNLPLQTESPGAVTMTDTGGNVVACSSQVAFVVSNETYLDCVGPQTTIASGSSRPPGFTLAVTTNSLGWTETLLPLVFSNTTSLVPLLPTSAILSSSAFRITSPSGTTLLSFPPKPQSTGNIFSIKANYTSAQDASKTSSSKNNILESPLPSSNNISVAAGLTSSKSTIGKNEALTSNLSHGPVSTLANYDQNSTSSAVSPWSSHGFISTIPPFTSASTQKMTLASPALGQNSTNFAVTQIIKGQGSSTSEFVVIGPSMTRMSPARYGISVGSETPMMTSPQLTLTTTETSLPPGASVQTLTSGAYLSNQWVTTTLAGSHSATVIPIILPPGGGPPVALWGVVPGPPPGGEGPTPPAIEIKVPNLSCVRIFGLIIEGCTPSHKDPHPSPDPPSDPSPTADKSPSERDSASKSASSTTSQSCSSTTATITSVICASSGTISSCSTMKTSSVGCFASGYATTTGSCVASTTVGSSTKCCSSATVSFGSTVCAFKTLTQLDLYVPPAQLQSSIGSMELMSQFSNYMITANASGSVVTSQNVSSSARPASSSASPSMSATSISRASKTTSKATSSPTITSSPLCVPFQDPDNAITGDICVCSTGNIVQTISSYLNPTSNMCGYTTMPYATNSSTMVTPTTKGPEFVYTITDLNYGWVQECTSTSIEDIAGYRITVCAGGLTTFSTVSSIAAANSAYGASMNSVSSASAAGAASVSAASAAAATPTAEVLITYYTSEIEDVSIYQYRAYDGTPGSSTEYCWSAKPISFVSLNHGTGAPTDFPTNELPSFSTHGVKGCNYFSTSNSQAGELTCPSWEQPVQCQEIVGSTAKEYQCPDFEGGTEQQPIILCEWGVDP